VGAAQISGRRFRLVNEGGNGRCEASLGAVLQGNQATARRGNDRVPTLFRLAAEQLSWRGRRHTTSRAQADDAQPLSPKRGRP
jgi:hypothetical protein